MEAVEEFLGETEANEEEHDELGAMLLEIEEEEEEEEDNLGGFGSLSSNEEEREAEAENGDCPVFLRFMYPLMQVIDSACSLAEPPIHYTMVCVNEEGRVRGDQRLMYTMNTLGDMHLSDTYLAHQLFLIGSQCNIEMDEWQGYVNRLNPEVAFKHEGEEVPPETADSLRERMLLLNTLTDFLEEAEDRVSFNYPELLVNYAAQHNITLCQNGEGAPLSPYVFFYECNIQGQQGPEAVRGSVGNGHHSEYPALRLIRILLKYGGPTEYAKEALLAEIGDEDAAAEDHMYGLLSVVD